MRVLALLVLLSMSQFVSAQEQSELASVVQPATKLEAFSATTGVVVVKGYTTIGSVGGWKGLVTVDAREFRDANNPSSAKYGVAITVKEPGGLQRENTSFIDEDEIDSLLQGLDYIIKIDASATSLESFEASYTTKGDLSVAAFATKGDDVNFAASSGRIGRVTAFLKLADATELRQFLAQAKEAIGAAKLAAE